uniref:COX assembly mitochondrial protein n=2 Tax=Canis lupus familiaris TaxID=9615 RepID=A0A8C0RC44_CANLF
MHPDSSPYLDTEACNVLTNLLKECHKNHKDEEQEHGSVMPKRLFNPAEESEK